MDERRDLLRAAIVPAALPLFPGPVALKKELPIIVKEPWISVFRLYLSGKFSSIADIFSTNSILPQ